MLKILLLVALGWLTVFILFAVYRYRAAHQGTARQKSKALAEVEPHLLSLGSGGEPEPAELERLAKNPLTRSTLFDLLLTQGRLDLFPSQFRTQVALAEGDLCDWLSHPNELGTAPDEIELVESLELPGADGIPRKWLVFQFRVHPPHWAAKDGWTAGVVGPLAVTDREPFPGAQVVFSTFAPIGSRTPAEHVQAVRSLAAAKGLSV